MYCHSTTATTSVQAQESTATPLLRQSRSYLTLQDLDKGDEGKKGDLATPIASITLNADSQSYHVIGDLKPIVGLLQKDAAATNQVITLQDPSAAISSKRSVSQTPRRKKQFAYVSICILVVAMLYQAGHSGRDKSNSVMYSKTFSFESTMLKLWRFKHDIGATLAIPPQNLSHSAFASPENLLEKSEIVNYENQIRMWNDTRSRAPMLTEWGSKFQPEDVSRTDLHPRPLMERPHKWTNLNGFWDFCLEDAATLGQFPKCDFQRKILVPFAMESALSGVMDRVGSDRQLVYRKFMHATHAADERLFLHFGAVDWKTWLWVDGHLVGVHEGGYDPFKFEVTEFIYRKDGAGHEIVVSVWDPTEDGSQPHGKQWSNKDSDRIIAPAGMWYTSVTGIWQTVWLEQVPSVYYLENIKMNADIENNAVLVSLDIVSSEAPSIPYVKIVADDGEGVVGQWSGWATDKVLLPFHDSHNTKLWSPDSPFLYNIKVSLHSSVEGPAIDEVASYFAMREVSLGRAGDATQFFLNKKPVFQYGILDQGWWPEGLYTAPSEEAMVFDLLKAKEFGFNLIRKHAKVEPSRFYYWCDKLGLLVWQDMPSSSGIYLWSPDGAHDFHEGEKSPEAAATFMSELQGVMDGLMNHPSVVAWIPFNEGWGQFKTKEVLSWMEKYDPHRMLWVSGGNDFGIGSAFDRHIYPGPDFVRLEHCRASVLGEFGGNGYAIREHVWPTADYESFVNWGYAKYDSLESLADHYALQMQVLHSLAHRGLGAAIFTQLTDVESEFNGLITYDRKVVKLNPEVMRLYHNEIYEAGSLPKFGLHSNSSSTDFQCPGEISVM